VEQPLLEHLQGLGVEVTHGVSSGYRDLMQDPLKSALPEAELTTIATYVSREHVRAAAIEADVKLACQIRQVECVETTPGGEPISERVLSFGPEERFFGILTETERSMPGRSRTVVLLLNTAPHTRVGPNRMYVPMARQLAARGFSSLRFDLRGVGDTLGSAAGERSPIYSKAFVSDVQHAMTELEALGYDRFVAVGLCAGAYLAFHSALADVRLHGVVMVNAQTFDWKDGDSLEIKRRTSVMSNAFYKRAILQRETWQRALTGKIDFRTIGTALLARTQHRAQAEARRVLSSLGVMSSAEWFDVAQSFATLLKRGVQTYLVYSEEDEGVDHLQAHVGTRLKRLQRDPRFQLELVKGSDHTFSQIWAQARLRDLIADHVEKHFRDPTGSEK
jgi:pimeloyl-ACP methyl ester carboxylesterase